MLDDRKSAILRAVVQQYIETAQPVGSSSISARSDVAVSSATVRNDMTVLEHDGYLIQPHTSAGRIPTEKGYRYFVDTLSGDTQLSPGNVKLVREFFSSAHGELEQMLADTSALLSNVTGTAAVVVGDATEVATIRSLQLVDLTSRSILAVAVLSTGSVIKRTIEMTEDVDHKDLEHAERVISKLIVGRSASTLGDVPLPASASALTVTALEAVREATESEGHHVFVDGRSRIAGSFDARETLEAVLEILEQQFVVVSLLKGLVDGGLAVSIGSESGLAPLAECSLVVAPYRLGEESAGAIAVLGPTRMNYPETLSAVAVVSRRLSGLLSEG